MEPSLLSFGFGEEGEGGIGFYGFTCGCGYKWWGLKFEGVVVVQTFWL